MEKSIKTRIKNDLENLLKQHAFSFNTDETCELIVKQLKRGYNDFDFKLEGKESLDNETNFEFVAIDPNNEKFKISVTFTKSMITS